LLIIKIAFSFFLDCLLLLVLRPLLGLILMMHYNDELKKRRTLGGVSCHVRLPLAVLSSVMQPGRRREQAIKGLPCCPHGLSRRLKGYKYTYMVWIARAHVDTANQISGGVNYLVIIDDSCRVINS
jgi:hypothetical protein